MGAEDMFVNLERDVCNDTAGGFHIYTETSLVGCMPKGCGAVREAGGSRASSSTAVDYRCLWDDENTVSGRILPRGRLESALCDTRGSH
jgi:hypothetical protein